MASKTSSLRCLGLGCRLILLSLLGAAAGMAGACSHSSEREVAAPTEEPPEAKKETEPVAERTGSRSSEAGEKGTAEKTGPATADDAESADALDLGQSPGEVEWQVDEEGRRYFLLGFPRDSPDYRWIDTEHTRIQAFYGQKFDVVDRDEENLYIRIYERSERAAARPPNPYESGQELAQKEAEDTPDPVEPTAEELLVFRPFGRGLPTSGQWRHGFDLADMNGDGHLDLIHGPARKGNGRPAIFLGDGQGSWRLASAARFPREHYDYGDVAVADFNGDGHQDLALAMHVRGLRVLVSDGEGRFTTWSEGVGYEGGPAGQSSVFSSRAVEAVDWNLDGLPDLVALGEGIKGRPSSDPTPEGFRPWSRGVALYLNNGDGTWTAADLSDDHRGFGDSLALGDFNGDGNPDAVTGSMSAGSRKLVVVGDGVSGATVQGIESLPSRGFVTAAASGDLDGDGLDDLVLGTTGENEEGMGSGIQAFYARLDDQGGLTWMDSTLFWKEGERLLVDALAVGDLGGSSLPDVVALSKEGEVWVFVNRGAGEFVLDTRSLREPIPGCRGYHAEIVPGPDANAVLVAGFSGERTGLPGIPGVDFEGCPGQGSLEAWAVSERQPENP